MEQLIYTTMGKVIVWGLLFGAAALWYIQKYVKSPAKGRGNKRLRIVDRLFLGNKEKLLLVEVDSQVLLLGVTAQHINVLNKQKTAPAYSQIEKEINVVAVK